jgi:hypothetical protein
MEKTDFKENVSLLVKIKALNKKNLVHLSTNRKNHAKEYKGHTGLTQTTQEIYRSNKRTI